MTWDWKKAARTRAGAPATAPSRARPRKVSETPEARPADVNRAAEMVWRSPEQPGESLPQLLYADEYECGFCRGGRDVRAGRCPVCRGIGRLQLTPPVVRCAFCRGQGQVPPRSGLTCCVCSGRGMVPVTPPIERCPDCKGRGRQRNQSLSCARCRGTGVVTAAAAVAAGTSAKGTSVGSL